MRFLPDSDQAEVRLVLENGEKVRSLAFDLGDKGYYSDFEGDGQWQQAGAGRGTWTPAEGKATLSYKVRITHPVATASSMRG